MHKKILSVVLSVILVVFYLPMNIFGDQNGIFEFDYDGNSIQLDFYINEPNIGDAALLKAVCDGKIITSAIDFDGNATLIFPTNNTSSDLVYELSYDNGFGSYSVTKNIYYNGEVCHKICLKGAVPSVTYDVNGGEGTPPVDNAIYNTGDVVTLKSGVSLTKTDFVFGGWATTPTGNAINGTTIDMPSGKLKLYAVWYSTLKSITAFSIGSDVGAINEANHTIAVTVPFGTAVNALIPTVAISNAATVSPSSGVANDFTNPVTYTVKAENGSVQDYTVTVTPAPDPRSTSKSITAFSIGSDIGVINETNHTIAVTVPFGTTVTALIPTVAISNAATVSPPSGVVNDFTNPVTYSVKAENGSVQDYTVTVTVDNASAPNSPNSPSYPLTTTTIDAAEIPSAVGSLTNVTATADSGAFSQPIEINVTQNAEVKKAVEDAIAKQLPNNNLTIFPLDISVYLKGTTTKVQPAQGKSVTITCPLPQSLLADKDSIIVACIIDGKLTILPTKVVLKNGVYCIEFTTTHFSPYAFVVDKEKKLSGLAAGAGIIDGTTTIVANGMSYLLILAVLTTCGIIFKKAKTKKSR